MGNDLDRYRQSPAAFRKKVRQWFINRCRWLSHGSEGGEIGKAVSESLKKIPWKQYQHKLYKNFAGSGVGRGIAVLVIIGVLTIAIKKHLTPTDPVLKILLDDMEAIALATAGVIFVLESGDRKKRSQYEAWQVVDVAASGNRSTSYARRIALEELNKDGVPLLALDLFGANLRGINLSFASLNASDLRQSNFRHAQLNGADLSVANLDGADWNYANLQGAKFLKTTLNGAHLHAADLSGAIFVFAKLNGADLSFATLYGTDFRGANLSGANLVHANLIGTIIGTADLEGANLLAAKLIGVSLQYAKGITQEQLSQAQLCEVDLPEGISIDPNRDCEELKISFPEVFK